MLGLLWVSSHCIGAIEIVFPLGLCVSIGFVSLLRLTSHCLTSVCGSVLSTYSLHQS